MLLAQAATGSPDLVAAAQIRTAAESRCAYTDTADVTVCGRRAADRFRVPFVQPDPKSAVPAERAALIRKPTPIEAMSPFLVGGGMAGATVGTTFGVSGSRTFVHSGDAAYTRPLAP